MDMEGHDHNHDHGSMGGMDMGGMDKYHGVIARRVDGSYYYTHGAFLGHVVPGAFFTIWSTWWLVATFHYYLSAAAARRQFTSRSWYPVFFGSEGFRKFPLEPVVKIVLPFCGILGELWLGHESWRTLHAPDGKFVVDNINDWQHSTMYSAFMTSGVVDLMGYFFGAPPGVERAFLGLAYLCQFLLLVFHLKGPPIEIMVHLILALQVASTVIAIIFEAANSSSIVAASVRPALTLLQGVWWIQTAYIMYVSDPAFDPEEMGGTMMTPVLLVMHMVWIAFASLTLLMVMRWLQSKMLGREVPFIGAESTKSESTNGGGGARNGLLPETMPLSRYAGEWEDDGPERALELAGLTSQK